MPDNKSELLASLSEQMASLQTLLDQMVVENSTSDDSTGTEYLQAEAEWVSDKIYKIKNGMPITEDNANAAAIGLLKCIKWLEQKIGEVERAIPGTDRFEALYEQLKELDVSNIREDLEYLRRYQNHINQYAKDKFWVEMFSARNTLSDTQAYEVEEAVGGSECVDVFDTTPLAVGRDYIIKSAAGMEEIRVSEILTNTRFRTTKDLKRSYHDAKLYRTTFAFADYEGSGGRAYASAGDVYYTKKINLNTLGLLQNVYIGRDVGDAIYKVYYRDESNEAADWTELVNKANIMRDDKTVENIYTLPAVQGQMELRVVCESGEGDVYYITIHVSYTDEGAALTHVPWGQITGDIANQKDLMQALTTAGQPATTARFGVVKLAPIPTGD